MRVLFHCVNGLGLGHLSRQTSIARSLRELVPRAEISFMTSAEEHVWLRKEKFPYYYVPSEPHYRFTWEVNNEEITDDIRRISAPIGLHDAIFLNLIDFLRPSSVIFDTYFSFEKVDAVLANSGTPIAFYDAWDSSFEFHENNIKHLLRQGGHILLGSDKHDRLRLDPNGRLHHIGRIVREPNWKRASEIKKHRDAKRTRIVCAQGGGGFNKATAKFYENNPEFFAVVLEVLNNIYKKGYRFDCLFVLGPYGKLPEKLAQPDWMKIVRFEPDLLEHCAASDIMISTGGYNAVSDSIVSNCPAVFLPIKEVSEDQDDHVKAICEQRAALKAPHDAGYLEQQILELIVNRDKRLSISMKLKQISKTTNGAERAARVIRDISL